GLRSAAASTTVIPVDEQPGTVRIMAGPPEQELSCKSAGRNAARRRHVAEDREHDRVYQYPPRVRLGSEGGEPQRPPPGPRTEAPRTSTCPEIGTGPTRPRLRTPRFLHMDHAMFSYPPRASRGLDSNHLAAARSCSTGSCAGTSGARQAGCLSIREGCQE